MDRRKQQSSKIRERRLRAKYRRNIRVAVVISLIVGLAVGFFAGRLTAPAKSAATLSMANATVAPTATPEMDESAATEEPNNALSLDATAEPASTALPTPTIAPTAAPTVVPEAEPIVVPFGSTQMFSAQINNDGSVRRDTETQTFETVNFSLRVLRYLTPEYYQETYASRYRMQGNEAGVEFELTLNDYMGSQTIYPQDLLTIGLETASGAGEQGYQLTDAEIQGSRVTVTTNVPTIAYKRFVFSESVGDMAYLSVTSWVDGVSQEYLFELGEPIRPTPAPTAEPTPVPEYSTLQVGSRGDEVAALQQKLIELGYLSGDADGRFGEMTAQAIRTAQAAFGMSETGVADNAFQQRLFSEGN